MTELNFSHHKPNKPELGLTIFSLSSPRRSHISLDTSSRYGPRAYIHSTHATAHWPQLHSTRYQSRAHTAVVTPSPADNRRRCRPRRNSEAPYGWRRPPCPCRRLRRSPGATTWAQSGQHRARLVRQTAPCPRPRGRRQRLRKMAAQVEKAK
jgi:hypothetical protein